LKLILTWIKLNLVWSDENGHAVLEVERDVSGLVDDSLHASIVRFVAAWDRRLKKRRRK
jgi:hypothetical protein